MKVCIYVEGGGYQKRTLTACRKAFRLFLEKVLPDRPHLKIVACGSRDEAYKDFCRALEDPSEPEALPLLLVDSEGPVHTKTAKLDRLVARPCRT